MAVSLDSIEENPGALEVEGAEGDGPGDAQSGVGERVAAAEAEDWRLSQLREAASAWLKAFVKAAETGASEGEAVASGAVGLGGGTEFRKHSTSQAVDPRVG